MRLFVENGTPRPLIDELRKATVELGNLDSDRGDTVDVSELAPGARAAIERQEKDRPPPTFLQANGGLLVVCATVLLSAIALALGLGNRGGQAGGTTSVEVKRGPGQDVAEQARKEADEKRPGEGDGEAEPAATALPTATSFASLRTVSAEQLAEVIAMLSPE